MIKLFPEVLIPLKVWMCVFMGPLMGGPDVARSILRKINVD